VGIPSAVFELLFFPLFRSFSEKNWAFDAVSVSSGFPYDGSFPMSELASVSLGNLF